MHNWMTLAANGLPMILLVGLWLILLRHTKADRWSKEKQVELLGQAVEALRQTNDLLKKLAASR